MLMSNKKLTVYDATKEELIQYFFHPLDGGFRVPSSAERFLIWLEQKRTGELLDAQDKTIEASQKYLHEYIDLVKQANSEPELDKKLRIFEKANTAYKLYEKAERDYKKIDKELGWNE